METRLDEPPSPATSSGTRLVWLLRTLREAGQRDAPGERMTATPPLATRRSSMAEVAGIPVEDLGLFTDLYQ